MIYIYILKYCPYCLEAINLLDKYKLSYKIIDVKDNKESYKKKHKMSTFPQIFYKHGNNKLLIGGYNELVHIIETTLYLKSNNIDLRTINYLYKNL
jgi:glutaredoxin